MHSCVIEEEVRTCIQHGQGHLPSSHLLLLKVFSFVVLKILKDPLITEHLINDDWKQQTSILIKQYTKHDQTQGPKCNIVG
jgi:hypothetical protein